MSRPQNCQISHSSSAFFLSPLCKISSFKFTTRCPWILWQSADSSPTSCFSCISLLRLLSAQNLGKIIRTQASALQSLYSAIKLLHFQDWTFSSWATSCAVWIVHSTSWPCLCSQSLIHHLPKTASPPDFLISVDRIIIFSWQMYWTSELSFLASSDSQTPKSYRLSLHNLFWACLSHSHCFRLNSDFISSRWHYYKISEISSLPSSLMP